jgi:hypothetical protein
MEQKIRVTKGNVIYVNFQRMSLTEAKQFLGDNYFQDAFAATKEDLASWRDNTESCLSGAADAYAAVYNYRFGPDGEPAKVLYLNAQVQRAA